MLFMKPKVYVPGASCLSSTVNSADGSVLFTVSKNVVALFGVTVFKLLAARPSRPEVSVSETKALET